MRAEYVALIGQIQRISNALLPADNPTASYLDDEVLRMFAFRLSAHAEIESFLEFCAESLTTHYSALNKQGKLTSQIQRIILLHNDMRETFPPRSLSVRPTKQGIGQRIESCMKSHLAIIEQNNGVSEKDILKLFIPLGFDLHYFDLDWLNAMNDLATARGEAAHNPWLGGGTVQPTPRGERDRFAVPLLGTRRLVAEALRLRALA